MATKTVSTQNINKPTDDEKNISVLAHVLGFFFTVLGPLIIWLIKKDESKYIELHSKEALNFQISMLIYMTAAGISMILIIGIIVMPVLIIFEIIVVIQAAMAASKGETYRYPITIRLIS